MRYVSAYLLAVLGGNASPKVDDLKDILAAVGVETDAETAKVVVGRLAGKSIEELIAEGSKGLVSVSAGAAAAPAAAAGAAAPAAEEKKAAKKEEPKEESDDDMGFGLFD